MPRIHSPLRRLRAGLSFANVVSLLALFVALGGVSYAAVVLPPNSVGRIQLKPGSVTTSRLAANSVGSAQLKPGSVTVDDLGFASVGTQALSPVVRAQLAQNGTPGPAGPQGASGPQGQTGSQGPRGPGAIRVRYAVQASNSPTLQPVLDASGLHLKAECQSADTGTQLNLSVTSDAAASFVENITIDTGADPFNNSGSANTDNLAINLPAGNTLLGGPGAATGTYTRVFAHALYVGPTSTLDISIAILVNANDGTCAIDGVGVPAS